MARPASADGPGRRARRRAETRTKLIVAARELMARQGMDATSIQEITDRADVGFGSFYNHFTSKEEIADAVMDEVIETFGASADFLAKTIDDPAEIVAASVRHGVRRATSDDAWGWFLVRRMLVQADSMRHGLGRRLSRDVRRGIDGNRFKVDDPQAVTLAIRGAVLAIMAGRLHGEIGADAPERAAVVVLRLLGVPPKRAHDIAHRPLPALGAPDGQH